MLATYQTRSSKEAKTLRGLGFEYEKEDRIYIFKYTRELGYTIMELRNEGTI